MKNKLAKYVIAFAVVFLATDITIEAKLPWDNNVQNADGGIEWVAEPSKKSNPVGGRAPFTDLHPPPPSYAQPPGGGDGQKLPVPGGLWILIGMAMTYGVVCRRDKKSKEQKAKGEM